MVIFLVINAALIVGLFVYWTIDPQFMGLPYFLFHIYPIYMAILAFFFKNKMAYHRSSVRVFTVLAVFLMWVIGVQYIYQTSLYD